MCEYNNKSYWNTISLCSSCPNDSYITTITINIKVEKDNDSIIHLPTTKEYEEAANKIAFQFTGQWSELKYQCPMCNGEMCKNLNTALLTYLAQYMYRCNKCGYIERQYI